MLKTYQSIYVVSHRWMFKNFGQGKAPQSKALFNAKFPAHRSAHHHAAFYRSFTAFGYYYS